MAIIIENQKVLKRSNGSSFATITYNAEKKWAFIDWNGFLSVDLVKEGSEELLKIFKSQKGCSKILVNNSNVSGPWNKANDWYATDWNPRAAEAGLKKMAVIVSENIFTQLSLQGFEKVSNGKFTVASFNSELAAMEWLGND